MSEPRTFSVEELDALAALAGTGHLATVHVDPVSGHWIEVACPFDAYDESRPCWPHNEDGSREPPRNDGKPHDCTWQEWMGEVGSDACNEWSVTVPLDCSWRTWDEPTLTLGAAASPDVVGGLVEALKEARAVIGVALVNPTLTFPVADTDDVSPTESWRARARSVLGVQETRQEEETPRD